MDAVVIDRWREELEIQATSIRRALEIQQRELERIEEQLQLLNRLKAVQSGSNELEKGGRSLDGTPNRMSEGRFEDEIEAVLEERGTPTHISDIRELLIGRGIEIPGQGKEANIIVRMGNQPERFVRTARGTYGLASWGIEPAALRVSGSHKRRRKTSAK